MKSHRLFWAAAALIVLCAGIQAIPYGRPGAPAPGPGRPFRWNAPGAEAIARSACYDCHSAETRWWWAVRVAPFSWLARRDIDEARRRLDFSSWEGRLDAEGLRRVLGHDMPPLPYTLAHPSARLGAAQRETLIRGFQASLAGQGAPVPAPPATAGALPSAAPVTPVTSAASAEAIIQTNCRACHTPGVALRYRTTDPARARTMIARMVRHGARIPAGAEPVLVDHFTRPPS